MKPLGRIAFVALLAALATSGYYAWRIWRPEASGEIRLSGNIEVTEAELGFQVPGRVAERLVSEGDPVQAGQLLARLDSSDQKLRVAQAKAQLREARAVLAELKSGARRQEIEAAAAQVELAKARLAEIEAGSREQEIEAARSEVDALQAEYARIEKDWRRAQDLHAEGALSEQRLDQAQTAKNVAVEKLKAAREKLALYIEGPRKETIRQAQAALRQAEEQYGLVVEGPRVEKIERAEAAVEAAEEQLRMAEQYLAYTRLEAPFDGVVLSDSAEPGEYLNPGAPVVNLGKLAAPWLRAFINERDFGRVRLGDHVEVTTDSHPGKIYEGRLTYISDTAEFTPKTVQTEEERVKLMYRVKVELESSNGELKPGMPADAVMRPSGGPGHAAAGGPDGGKPGSSLRSGD